MAIATSLLAAAAATVNRSVQPLQRSLQSPRTSDSQAEGDGGHDILATYNDLRPIASTAAPTTDQTLDLTSAWIAYRRCSKERP